MHITNASKSYMTGALRYLTHSDSNAAGRTQAASDSHNGSADRVTLSDEAKRLASGGVELGPNIRAAIRQGQGQLELVNLNKALQEGLSALETHLQQTLPQLGLPNDAQFELTYDAEQKRIRVAADAEIQPLLEETLNSGDVADGVPTRGLVQAIDRMAQVQAAIADVEDMRKRGESYQDIGFSYEVVLSYMGGNLTARLTPNETLATLLGESGIQ